MNKHWNSIEHKHIPRDNQKIAIDEGIDGLLNVGFHGHLLEMSLGKTKIALNEAEILRKYGVLDRVLIICPKSIQSEWVSQTKEHTFMEDVPFIWESKKTHKYKRQVKAFLKREFPVLIVRIEMFQRKNTVLKDFLKEYLNKPTYMILDESSKIKSINTQRTPRLIDYTFDAKYKTILTGTPWSESPIDIFAQMIFLKPNFWEEYEGVWRRKCLTNCWYTFKRRYAIIEKTYVGHKQSYEKIVGAERQEELAQLIQPYITQQKKKDWQDLPEKIFHPLYVEMNAEHSAAYEEMKEKLILERGDEIITAANAGVLFGRLRQIAGGFYPGRTIIPAGIERMLDDVAEYAGKVIVSCSYRAEVEDIAKILEDEYGKDAVEIFYGATKNRDEVKKRFQNDDTLKFLVGTQKVMAYGHNWQFCSLMYRYSLEYSYEMNVQLVDRIHRPGMSGNAVYKDIIHKGTVQEKALEALRKKKSVVDAFYKLTVKDFLNNG